MPRIIFAGSPDFAVPALERLAGSHHDIVAVLTQPDRPAGRGRKLQASPVKTCALAHGLTVLQPDSLKRDERASAQLRTLAPDVMIVIAYGLLLPRPVLDIPRCGCVNIHASLLPRWRGAAPIQTAILAGDAVTGVSLMRLDEGLDTGPVAFSRRIEIAPGETAGELQERLALTGADLLMTSLDSILDGTAHFVPQSAVGASYAPKLAKADALLDWLQPAVSLARRVRACNPWPVAETRLDGAQLRCWRAHARETAHVAAAPAGSVLAVCNEGIDVQTGEGVLRLTSVQLAGRQQLSAGVFARGYPVLGKVLGR